MQGVRLTPSALKYAVAPQPEHDATPSVLGTLHTALPPLLGLPMLLALPGPTLPGANGDLLASIPELLLGRERDALAGRAALAADAEAGLPVVAEDGCVWLGWYSEVRISHLQVYSGDGDNYSMMMPARWLSAICYSS